jgi:multiple sugar transport system substrate-binding protein
MSRAGSFEHGYRTAAKVVDEKGNVAVNRPETIAALEWAPQLYDPFIPGTLSWLDPSNNKAFLDGAVGVSVRANHMAVGARRPF